MPHQVQQLINKIRTEGIEQANANAQEIENDAKNRAEAIIAEAEQKAGDIVMNAEGDAKKMREAGERALEQAARNMLLSLRKDIESILSGIMTQDVGAALSSERIGNLIQESIEKYMSQHDIDDDIHVFMSENTLKELGDGFVARLQERFKKNVIFKPSADVNTGFMVSFDSGKTNFDFTDESLAAFLSVYMNEKLGEILKRTVI